MFTRFLFFTSVLVAAVAPSAGPVSAQAAAPAKFALTVDSIMRGPDLVGYPPDSLRWSADSRKLFFEWRRPGEDEPSTYVVDRDGGVPVKLTGDAEDDALPAGAVWDGPHKRAVAAVRGDIVLFDEQGRHHQLTRTSARESNPRWARHDKAVTYVSDGNLFLIALDRGGEVEQVTDVSQKKPDPRLTDSQKFIRQEEEKLLDVVKEEKEQKRKAEAEENKRKLPAFDLQDRQSAVDLMLSPDDTHVFIVVAERPAGARSVIVPSYVNETGYTEDINGRTAVGDTQARRLLAILNLKTGKSVWADGSFAPPVDEPKPADTGSKPPAKAERDVRWSMPDVSDDGTIAVAGARSADNKDRWYVEIDPESGKTRVVDTLHDNAWIREVGGGGFGASGVEFFPGTHRIWFLSERDGWMHLYSEDLDANEPKAKQLTSG